jgi:hypothetical protein
MVRRRLNAREILFIVGGSLVMLAVLTFYLWHITENVRLGYAIGSAEDELQRLQSDIRILEIRKAAHLAPGVVDRTAREKLGLTDPREDQIIVEDDRR